MENFQKVLKELIELFQELIGIETMKLDAAGQDRVATVEECMKKEQAKVLMLKGLERERERAQKEAGYEGMTFREILEQVSEEERELLLPLFDGLSRQIQMFQEVSEDASHLMEMNLYRIKKILEARGDTIYTEDGNPVPTAHHMTNRRV